MGTIRRGALGLIAGATMVAGPLAGGATASPGSITGTPGHGCPSGAFCVYPTSTTWNTGPEAAGKYYSYGAHNVHGQSGNHLVYNNQYAVNGEVAGVSFCTGWNGTGQNTGSIVNDHWAAMVNMSPVYSVTLWLYDSRYTDDINCDD